MERIILRSRLLWLPYDVSCCTRQGRNATVHRSVAKKRKEKKRPTPFRILLRILSIQKLMLSPSGKYRNIIHPYEIIDSFFFFSFTSSFVSFMPVIDLKNFKERKIQQFRGDKFRTIRYSRGYFLIDRMIFSYIGFG